MGTSLSGKKIKDSYDGLIKTNDNASVGATDKELTDGLGNDLNISVNTSGDITADGTVEAASIVKTSGTSDQILLADGTTIDVIQESETIGTNDNDTSIPTSAAVKDYVDDEISDLIGGAPSTLDTLNEIAAALDDNDSFSDTVVLKTGSTMTGNLESTGFVKTGGTSSEFLKADGSVDSNTYLTSATDTTYTISAVDGDNADEEKIRITGSDSTTDDVVLEAGTGLTIARSGDKITFTNSSTGTTYSTSVVDSGDDAIIRLTGSDSTTDDITLEAGSNITLTPSGDTLTIASTASGGGFTVNTENFSGDNSDTTFDLSNTISDEDNTQIFIDGVYQSKSNYSTSGQTITFTTAPPTGSNNIEVVHYIMGGSQGCETDSFNGDDSTTSFTLTTEPSNENHLQVFIDGVYQSKSNYSVSGTSLTFTTAPPTGTGNVEVVNIKI